LVFNGLKGKAPKGEGPGKNLKRRSLGRKGKDFKRRAGPGKGRPK
jgi:hypothetical protein